MSRGFLSLFNLSSIMNFVGVVGLAALFGAYLRIQMGGCWPCWLRILTSGYAITVSTLPDTGTIPPQGYSYQLLTLDSAFAAKISNPFSVSLNLSLTSLMQVF